MFAVVRKSVCSVLVAAAAASISAQEVQTDAKPFRKPALFVVPDPPLGVLKEHEERIYDVTVSIDERGQAMSILSLAPDDDEFRVRVEEVRRFWLFYPMLDRDECKPVPSDARVRLEYLRGEKLPQVSVVYDPMGSVVDRDAPKALKVARTPSYPFDELRAGISGNELVAVAVRSDGTVEAVRHVIGLPESKSFRQVANEHAMKMLYEPGTAPSRCVLVDYRFILK